MIDFHATQLCLHSSFTTARSNLQFSFFGSTSRWPYSSAHSCSSLHHTARIVSWYCALFTREMICFEESGRARRLASRKATSNQNKHHLLTRRSCIDTNVVLRKYCIYHFRITGAAGLAAGATGVCPCGSMEMDAEATVLTAEATGREGVTLVRHLF